MKQNKQTTFQYNACDKIIDEIEKLDIVSFRQYYHYSFNNWLPFRWRGYTQSTRYTYVIDDTSDMDVVIKGYNNNVKKGIAKAKKVLELSHNNDMHSFYKYNKMTFDRQGIDIPYSLEFMVRLEKYLISQNCYQIICAKDIEGNVHSMALFVWDDNCVYYIASGSDSKYRESQSLTLLLHEGLLLASRMEKKFDFEGSMMKQLERYFRQFGGVLKPYYDIQKTFY